MNLKKVETKNKKVQKTQKTKQAKVISINEREVKILDEELASIVKITKQPHHNNLFQMLE